MAQKCPNLWDNNTEGDYPTIHFKDTTEGSMEHEHLDEDAVIRMTDLFAAFQWLQRFQIDTKGVSDLEGAKCRLLQYLQEHEPTSRARETSNVSLLH